MYILHERSFAQSHMSCLMCGCTRALIFLCLRVCVRDGKVGAERPNRVPISSCKWAQRLPSNICVQWEVNGPPVYTSLTISHDVTVNPLWTDLSLSKKTSLLIFHLFLFHSPRCLQVQILLVKPHFFFLLCTPHPNSLSLSLSLRRIMCLAVSL